MDKDAIFARPLLLLARGHLDVVDKVAEKPQVMVVNTPCSIQTRSRIAIWWRRLLRAAASERPRTGTPFC